MWRQSNRPSVFGLLLAAPLKIGSLMKQAVLQNPYIYIYMTQAVLRPFEGRMICSHVSGLRNATHVGKS